MVALEKDKGHFDKMSVFASAAICVPVVCQWCLSQVPCTPVVLIQNFEMYSAPKEESKTFNFGNS